MLRLLSIFQVVQRTTPRTAPRAGSRAAFRTALPALLLAWLLVAGLSACAPTATPEAPPDPMALVNEAVTNMRAAQTFRIAVTEAGPDYKVFTEFATVFFRQAIAQYVAPGMMQATVRVLAAGLPVEIQVFSNGADQWYRAIWTANQWVNQKFAPDFNPETLISENSGFQAALKAMIELRYAGIETLESGAQTFHLTATANGPDMSALFGGLIAPVGIVGVDVYIDQTTRAPVRFLVTEHNSPFVVTPESGQKDEPVVWTIDLYDVNAPSEISTPEAAPASAATPETTPAATAEAAS